MDQSKPWFQSIGVWGGLVSMFAGVIGLFGYHMSPDDVANVSKALAQGAQLLSSIVAVVGGIIAVYGRVVATKKIAAPPAA